MALKWQTDNRNDTVEAKYVIFIKNFPVFVPPKTDRKYSHTNSYICAVTAIMQDDHRSQLELGPPVAQAIILLATWTKSELEQLEVCV